MIWEEVRNQFPIMKEYIYLDVGNQAALPLFITRVLEDHYRDQQVSGGNKDRWLEIVADCRKNFAELINARPSEIAFVKNTSEGLNIAANGIRFRSGDNVILNYDEHPNNI